MGVRGIFLVVAVVACASSGSTAAYEQGRSPTQILSDADLATISTHSFHLSIEETAESGPVSADVDIEDGNAAGKILAGGIRMRITHVKDQTFIYGSDLAQILYKTNNHAADAVNSRAADKWVLVPNDIWSSGFSKALDVAKMSSCLKGLHGVVKKGTTAISGQQAVELDDEARARMFVQTAAPHHYVRVVFPGPDNCAPDSTAKSQTIDMSQFGAKFHIAAPAGYADLATLAAGG